MSKPNNSCFFIKDMYNNIIVNKIIYIFIIIILEGLLLNANFFALASEICAFSLAVVQLPHTMRAVVQLPVCAYKI